MFKRSKLLFTKIILDLNHYYITTTTFFTTMSATTSNINDQLERSQKPEGQISLLDIRSYLPKFCSEESIMAKKFFIKMHIKSAVKGIKTYEQK